MIRAPLEIPQKGTLPIVDDTPDDTQPHTPPGMPPLPPPGMPPLPPPGMPPLPPIVNSEDGQ